MCAQDVLPTKANLQYLVRNGVTHIDAYIGKGEMLTQVIRMGEWASSRPESVRARVCVCTKGATMLCLPTRLPTARRSTIVRPKGSLLR